MKGRRKRRPTRAPEGWGRRFLVAVETLGLVHPTTAEPSTPDVEVLSFEPDAEGVRARVRANGTVHETRLSLRPLPQEPFERALAAMAGKARWTASLLFGRVPDELETALAPGRRSLLPRSRSDVALTCSCGRAPACEHSAALLHAVASRVSEEPFLLLVLRGHTRESVAAALQRHRTPTEGETLPRAARVSRAPLPRVGEKPELFFKPRLPLGSLRTAFTPPEHAEAVLLRLGPPPFSDPTASELLSEIHRAVGIGAAEKLEEWEWRRVFGRGSRR